MVEPNNIRVTIFLPAALHAAVVEASAAECTRPSVFIRARLARLLQERKRIIEESQQHE